MADDSAALKTSEKVGLKTVAVFEAIKGVLVLLAGFGLLALAHRDLEDLAEHLVFRLHLNPEGHISHAVTRFASRLTDAKLWAVFGGIVSYTSVRFVEAYGLWHARDWAEWFALLSGTLYLPWEVYEIIAHPAAWRWILFVGNLLIVLYMAYVRLRVSRS